MMAKCVRVPGSSPWVQGLLNLRGVSVPVLDIQACFDRRERRPELSDFVIICRVFQRRIGLVVQEVVQTELYDSEEFEEATQDISCARYLLGIIQTEGKTVLAVSVQQIVIMSELLEEKE